MLNSRTFIMWFNKFEFYEWSPEIIDSNVARNNWLPIGMNRDQSRTPNDRCAFENNFWPVITERLNIFRETSACKRKIYGFVQPLRTKK